MYPQLAIATLLEHTTLPRLNASTYILRGQVLVRLFNSRSYIATQQALFPNNYKKHLSKYFEYSDSNEVKQYLHDYKDGKATSNRKTDLIYTGPIEISNDPSETSRFIDSKTFLLVAKDFAYDNNTTSI